MTPSFLSNALRSIVSNTVPMQNDLPLHLRGSCASTENRQEELELLDLADTVLADNNWRWLHHLLDLVHDIATRQRGKMYFARLFKSQNAAEIEVALSEMETWRQELGDESARPREHDLARALFLLGYDKSLSLTTL